MSFVSERFCYGLNNRNSRHVDCYRQYQIKDCYPRSQNSSNTTSPLATGIDPALTGTKMEVGNDIELGRYDNKRNITIDEGPATRPQSRKDAGQTYGHSTGSSGRRNLDVSISSDRVEVCFVEYMMS